MRNIKDTNYGQTIIRDCCLSFRDFLEENYSETWIDHTGYINKSILNSKNLDFKRKAHARLRAFIYWRDNYQCIMCGIESDVSIAKLIAFYDGRYSLGCANKGYFVVDHILPRNKGGINHPANLQTLCSRCNSKKAKLSDCYIPVRA
jgi:hypothetical protein